MASIIFARECPQCGRSAVEDNYYKTDETTIICYRCGYYYSKKIEEWTKTSMKHKEVTDEGHGIMSTVDKEGEKTVTILNRALTQEELDQYRQVFNNNNNINQEKSFLVTYKDGVFTIQYGTPSENFYLPFQQYKEKMIEKYGEHEYSDLLVPIED